MPKEIRQGWVAPKPEGIDYNVNGQHHTGVFVQHIPGTVPSLEYAGSGTKAGRGFSLPTDPVFLRDIAEAIKLLADDIETGL